MRVLVTGIKGQLGYDIVKECATRGIEAIGVDVDEMDIVDKAAVEKVISESNVDAVIHCAAYTAVDAAEENISICEKVNVDGTENIAEVCRKLDIKMMYFSTDYVFKGDGEEPWKEDDKKEPLNVYGRTKYEGELAVQRNLDKYFVLRISWVFGINGRNFIKTMLKLGHEKGKVSVVNDQFGAPTYTVDLAKVAVDMIITEKYGVYHVTNMGDCSWYEFACEIFKKAGMSVDVSPVDSTIFSSKAKRPKNSRMSKSKLKQSGFELLPSWQNALERYLHELNI